MRLLARQNKTTIRIQALFVAMLYVMLCTFGMVTHSHVSFAPSASTASAVASGRPGTTAPPIAAFTQAHASDGSCTLCEWQAKSLSPALPALFVVRAPLPETLAVSVVFASLPAPFMARFASRAPPAV